MNLGSAELPGDQDTVYFGQIQTPEGTRHMGIVGGTPQFLDQARVATYFGELGMDAPDLMNATISITTSGDVALLRPSLVEQATAMRSRDSRDFQMVVNAVCINDKGQHKRHQFSDRRLLGALLSRYREPLQIPMRDTFGINQSLDSRHPVVVEPESRERPTRVLLPYSEMSTLQGAEENAFRSFTASVVNQLYNVIEVEDLVDTPKGRYYLAVLMEAARVRPERLNATAAALRKLGLNVDKLLSDIDRHTDKAQEQLTSKLVGVARRLELKGSTVDGIRTFINLELATDFRDLDSETLFGIVEQLAAYETHPED